MSIQAESWVKVVKGCKARDISKGEAWFVVSITELGADYSHMVRVVLRRNGRTVSWTARHVNRLVDSVVRLNDGNPCNVIEITSK